METFPVASPLTNFNGPYDDVFAPSPAATLALLWSSDVGRIYLDADSALRSVGVNHHGAALLEHAPCGLVAFDREGALELFGRDPPLVSHHQEGRLQPYGKWALRVLHDVPAVTENQKCLISLKRGLLPHARNKAPQSGKNPHLRRYR